MTGSTLSSSVRREESSFRDPSGYLFWRDGSICRYVAPALCAPIREGTRIGTLRGGHQPRLALAAPQVMWDIGGNNGFFSHAVRDLAGQILCMDIDAACVDQN